MLRIASPQPAIAISTIATATAAPPHVGVPDPPLVSSAEAPREGVAKALGVDAGGATAVIALGLAVGVGEAGDVDGCRAVAAGLTTIVRVAQALAGPAAAHTVCCPGAPAPAGGATVKVATQLSELLGLASGALAQAAESQLKEAREAQSPSPGR
jgi:hypothetical protein